MKKVYNLVACLLSLRQGTTQSNLLSNRDYQEDLKFSCSKIRYYTSYKANKKDVTLRLMF